jgi:hypothetical protein
MTGRRAWSECRATLWSVGTCRERLDCVLRMNSPGRSRVAACATMQACMSSRRDEA